MSRLVGIDLGTTNSLVAWLDGDRPQIIPNRAGQRMTPSVVGLDREDRVLVGLAARNLLLTSPDRAVAEVKRIMGTPQRVNLGSRGYSPTEISGFILKALKEDAERFFGDTVDEAVITVPAYFTDAQRQATKDAGELAGLKVERILNEPTAAALAYGLDHLDQEQFVMVYDLGGGTFDVSVLEMFNGVLDVKASAGNSRLGGSDFDQAVVEHLCAEFLAMHGLDLHADARAMARLKAAAEQAKVDLSASPSTQVLLPCLAVRDGRPLNMETELSRTRFERLIGDLVRSTLDPVDSALKDARIERTAISDVVLVGGSSRVPMVRQLVAEYFGKEPRTGVHPDEAVALGAAVQAGLKSGAICSERGIMITDVCPFTLGVEVQTSAGSQKVDGLFSPIIPRNSTVPISRTETYSTTTANQRQVDVKVFQGESRLTRHNVFLDMYTVDGIPPGPSGKERVAITFTYDINGILKVTTKVVSTGKEAVLVVDKSPRRLDGKEKEEARARLDKEWNSGGAAPASNTQVPAEIHALLERARARMDTVKGDARMQLTRMVADLEEAIARKDLPAVSRLDVALTDLLFDME